MHTLKFLRIALVGFILSIILAGSTASLQAVPSFARQTGLACQACHTVFPELTPFGRLFKLNGYQIDNIRQVQGITPAQDSTLLLNEIPPLSFMLQTSYTRTGKALPDSTVEGATAQNGQILLPQQVSLFYAGRIAPNLGAFVQMTYEGGSGAFGLDNTELRYAKQVGGVNGVTFGVTLNNNPTVQDVWNTTSAWRMPFDQVTSAAPAPGAGSQIDGGLTDRGVVGLTGYVWLKNSTYAEAGVYRSAPQGFAGSSGDGPLDSTAGGVVTGGAPYWRVAHDRQWGHHAFSVGAYGMNAKLGLEGQAVGPPTDRFRDVAFDSQYQYIGDKHLLSVQTTYIKEHQTLNASFAEGISENPTNDLRTVRLGGSYYFQRKYGAALGVFSTSGTSDASLYAGDPISGFAAGNPDSRGWTGELNYVPWQNVRLILQYVRYQKFNGGSTNYDEAGRNAGDNNTLYGLCWFAF
jgi:hypothetical protein